MNIKIDNLSYVYEGEVNKNRRALDGVSLNISSGSITGIIGHSGSGKSTLIQLVAGLLKPTIGSVKIGNYCWNDKVQYQKLRKKVGIVFQYPEHQLFEETVEKEIAFGPKNFGFLDRQISESVKEVMEELKLSYKDLATRSPFDLSGGQKRKVAIASVLAHKPKVLILDEPTAGLDSTGRKDIMEIICKLHNVNKLTTLIVSHNMDEIANISDNIVVLNDGKVLLNGSAEKVFADDNFINENSLDVPEITKLIVQLNKKLKTQIPLNCFSIDVLENYLFEYLKEQTK